jgi:hypothetical protein
VATSGHLGKGSASAGHAQGRRGARGSAGIHATSEVIGELDAVQTRIGEVVEEQVQMAKAFERG